jgi:hypothetical protein
MSGSIFVREKVAWIASYGTYDQIIGRLKRSAEENGDETIVNLLALSMEPYLRHVELRGLDREQFRVFARNAQRAYERFCLDGPSGYGGDPSVFDRVRTQFDELLAAIAFDSRMDDMTLDDSAASPPT